MSHADEDWYAADAPLKAAGIVELLADAGLRPETLLDVGCGGGDVLAGVCAGTGAHGIGLDPDPEAVERARALGLEVHLGAVGQVELTADLVLCIDVFEHVPDDVSFLRELRAHGSRALFRIPLDDSLWDRVRGRTAAFRERYGHLHAYTRRRALARLREGGWEPTVVRFHRIPAGGRVSRGVRRLTEQVAPRVGARVIGGWSLLVLAEAT